MKKREDGQSKLYYEHAQGSFVETIRLGSNVLVLPLGYILVKIFELCFQLKSVTNSDLFKKAFKTNNGTEDDIYNEVFNFVVDLLSSKKYNIIQGEEDAFLIECFLKDMIIFTLNPDNQNVFTKIDCIENYIIHCCDEDFNYFAIEDYLLWYTGANGYKMCRGDAILLDSDSNLYSMQNIEIMGCGDFLNAYHNNDYIPASKYEIKDLSDICAATIYEILTQKLGVKRCANCGRFFVPKRSDALYCNRKAPQNPNITCKGYCKAQKEKAVVDHSEMLSLYKKIYNKKLNRVKREKDESKKAVLQNDFDKFILEAKDHRERISNIPIGANFDWQEAYLLYLKQKDKE